MTRNEFMDNPPSDIGELMSFCYENDLNACDDIIPDENLDTFVEDDVREFLRNDYWYNLWPLLRDIPTGYCWYLRTGMLEYCDAEEDLDTYIEYAVNEMDRYSKWDTDPDDEEEEEEYAEEDEEDDTDDEPADEECFCAFSVDVFIGDSASSVTAVRQKGEELARKKEEADREYRTFVIKAEADEKKREEEAFSENRAAFETLILR